MTKKKPTDAQLERINLVLRTIRSVDQVLLEEKDRRQLIKGICDSLVKTRGYYNAWIALLDSSGRFATFAEAGLEDKFVPLQEQLEREGATRCGQEALAQAGAVVTGNPVASCIDCPLARGYSGRGGITARLQYRGKLYGLLTASVPASLVTEVQECSLFEDIAGDIAFALHETELEEERERMEHELQERVRELSCLYGVSDILERADLTLEETLQEIANLLPHSWRYPEIACARVSLEEREFKTGNYHETKWQQTAAIKVHGGNAGTVVVGYLEERPQGDEGPFSSAERQLVNAVAERLGRRIEHRRTEEALTQSEDRYRALFDSANDGMLVRDLSGKILMANEAMAGLTGYTTAELTTMNISHMLFEADFKTVKEYQGKQLKNGSEVKTQRYELQITRKDGAVRIIEVVTNLLAGGESQPVIQTIARDVTEQRRARENLRAYASRVIMAQEEERKRVARELHDETAQAMASLGIELGSLAQTKGPYSQRLGELRHRVEDILRGIRSLSQGLRPPMLEEFGLLATMEYLAKELREQRGINIHFKAQGTVRRFAPDIELALFRIVQEALTNIGKHSEATGGELKVVFAPEKVKITVRDNGRGFQLTPAADDIAYAGTLGLNGMRERSKLIDGNLKITSEPDQGTTVVLELPR